jgi:dTDP-4-dehydrorhamnose 3,5-epimerase
MTKVILTELPDVKLIEPKLFKDDRGLFFESFQQERFEKELGISVPFIQDNLSYSTKGVLRGLHYQLKNPQGKLVQVISGEVFDVAVDLRKSSPTYGKWAGFILSDTNRRSAWIPPGFAHGFYVLSESAYLSYKCTAYYTPGDEYSLLWNDPTVAIHWPLTTPPHLSDKDAKALSFIDSRAHHFHT